VRSVEGEDAVRYMQRLAALHTSLVRAAAGSDRYELRRSAEVGQGLLWEPQACSRPETAARPQPTSSPANG
jgi:hypothetical protein